MAREKEPDMGREALEAEARRQQEEGSEKSEAAKVSTELDATMARLAGVIKDLEAKGVKVSGGAAAGSAATDNVAALQAKLNAASSELNGAEGQQLQREMGDALLGGLTPVAFILGKDKDQEQSNSIV